MEHEFTLKYRLAADAVSDDEIMSRLQEAGCDDALVGLGVPGIVQLDFIHEADSLEAAIQSAKADVERALPAAQAID